MFDFSEAAGLEPTWSSFSRRDFSWEMILLVAILEERIDEIDKMCVMERDWRGWFSPYAALKHVLYIQIGFGPLTSGGC